MRLRRACRVIVPALVVVDLLLGWQLVQSWEARDRSIAAQRAGTQGPRLAEPAPQAPDHS